MSRVHHCHKDGAGAHGQGTNACYTLCKCRCYPCSGAGVEYRRRRDLANRWGESLTVDAEPIREHVRTLMCKGKRGSHHGGVGLKQISKVSGVPHGSLWKLMYGAPDRAGPSKKVRRATAEKILAVTRDDMADGASIPGGPTLRKLDAMVAGGFAKAELARYLTGNPNAYALQVGLGPKRRVSAGNARKVDELYRRWKAGQIAPRGRRSRHHDDGVPPVTPMEVNPRRIEPKACEDCGAPSLAGGRWCWPCFKIHAEREAA